jgi:hypothetical protein
MLGSRGDGGAAPGAAPAESGDAQAPVSDDMPATEISDEDIPF